MFEETMDNSSGRGCGELRAGMIYLTMGWSKHGIPFDDFRFDPVIPIPDGLEIAKRGLNIVQFQGVDVVADWLGAAAYPDAEGWIQETKRKGLRILVEDTFPFQNLRPDMYYMPVHPHACTLDEAMLKKFYEERLSHENAVGVQCFSRHYREEHLAWKGIELTELVESEHFCGGLLREALQDQYGEDVYRPIVTASVGEGVEFEGRVAPPDVPWHPGFIMFLPMASVGFSIWKDRDGQWEDKLESLKALPDVLKGNVNVFETIED